MVSDATIEKDESHAGKVCLRSWYEKNKHIFPASRWEPYDPEKKWDKYTISDSLAVIWSSQFGVVIVELMHAACFIELLHRNDAEMDRWK